MRTLRFRIAFALAFVAAIGAAWGAAVSVGADTGRRHPYTIPHVLRFAWDEDVGGLNPHLDNQVIVSYLSELTMAWLLKNGRDNRPIPELAIEVPTLANGGISADGRTVTFHLRHGVRWSDGAPFTAHDVVFSTKTVLNPRTNEQTRYGFDVIDGVRAPDPYTVVVHLRHPYAAFLMQYFNSGGVMCVLPAHLLESLPTINQAPYNALPVGIGPFRYTRWRRGDEVDMEANPYYFRGRPKLRRIVYKIVTDDNTIAAEMQAHDIDLWIEPRPLFFRRLERFPGLAKIRMPSFTTDFLEPNVARGPLADLAVRRALRLAVDRKRILETIGQGLGELNESFYPATHPMHAPIPFIAPNPREAARLLDADGWHLGSDGLRHKGSRALVLDLAAGSGLPTVDQEIELMRADLQAVGIGLLVDHYQASVMFGPGGILDKGKFDVTLVGQSLDSVGDLSVDFACDQSPPNGYNFGHFCDPELDRAMAAFNGTYDERRRSVFAAIVASRIADRLGAIVWWTRDTTYLMNDDLRGFTPNNFQPFEDMMRVDI